MVVTCSLDTSILFTLTKKEAASEACKRFLENVPSEHLVLSKTVKDEYFYTLDSRMQILQRIFREIGYTLSGLSYRELKQTMQRVFSRYKREKSLDRSAKEWIRRFEVFMNERVDKLHESGLDVRDILSEVSKDLQDIKRNYVVTYNLVEKKVHEFLTFEPNKEIFDEFRRIVLDDGDCRHLSVYFEYAVRNDKWVFFITIDEIDLLSKQTEITKKFFFIKIENPMYTLFHIEETKNSGPPLNYIKGAPLSEELKELNILTNRVFGIALPLSKE